MCLIFSWAETSFFLVQRLSWDFESCSFLFFLFLVCSASNNAQSRTRTAPDIRKDKKKIWEKIKKKKTRPILSVGMTTFGIDCCTRLSFFVLFIALAWNGYNFDLHKENNSCEICLNSKSSQECVNSLQNNLV